MAVLPYRCLSAPPFIPIWHAAIAIVSGGGTSGRLARACAVGASSDLLRLQAGVG